MGTARTVRTYSNLVHIVKLDSYEETIERIATTIRTFKNSNELKDSIEVTKLKLLNLQQKLRTLKPIVRNKRGLINGLGSIIKTITGNMDAQDADKLNKEIENLAKNQGKMNSEINRQTVLNNKMIERFENITNHINTQQESITSYLISYQEQTRNSIRINRDITNHIQYLNLINYNIDLLTNHLINLAEAIVLARLNIISKQILNHDEIVEIYNNLRGQSVEIASSEEIYTLLGLQAYYNGSNLIFNVRIPILSQQNYSMLHIIPLPINNSKIFNPKPYLIYNTRNIQYFDETCQRVEKTYYCKESAYQEDTDNSTCIGRLLQNEPARCILTEQLYTTEILQPEPNHVLIIDSPEIIVNTTCEIKQFKIKGTKLIHFENCSVKINNILYFDHISSHWDDIHIYPTIPTNISYSSTMKDLKLEKMHSYHFNNRQAIELLEVRINQKNHLMIGIITVTSALCLVVIIYLIYKKTSERAISPPTLTKDIHSIQLPQEGPKPKYLWPSLHTKGGGVTESRNRN